VSTATSTAREPSQTAPGIATGKELCGHLMDMADCAANEGRVVLVRLSRFEIVKHQPALNRFARELLTGLTIRRDARIFELSGGDLVLVCHLTPVDEVNAILGQIAKRIGVSNANDGQDTLCSWFDLTAQDDFDSLISLADDNVTPSPTACLSLPPLQNNEPTLTPNDLEQIRAALAAASIKPFMRKQKALLLSTQQGVTPLLTETYLAISEIRERFAAEINFFARPALFHFLTLDLDRHLLSALTATPPTVKSGLISLNLNIASVFSSEFEKLDTVWQDANRPIIEIQFVDVLTDGKAFADARDDLQARGYKVLIDGLNPENILYAKVEHLRADFVKILWCEQDAQITKSKAPELYKKRVNAIGRDRLILARAETEDAIKWALGLGITRFQGHYIDRLVEIMAAKKLI